MSKLKVLVVEDDSIIIIDLKRRIPKIGYELVGVFSKGEDAIEHVEVLKPDIILMDVMLDGMLDGIETAKLIHNQTDVPILFLTSMVDEETFQRAKITSPYAYIIKPVTDRELQINIEIALYQKKIDKEKSELINQLQEKNRQIKELSGLIPICSNCKNVRNDKGYWFQVEEYIRDHTNAEFTHSLCPICIKKLYPELAGTEE
ncbi:MAG: response regulator [Candidatus Cloacimonadales bacterium]|jgi:CheY-like chemotaxis protein|nr:response regulator [Candidatus Cloacimonadota bacterium]MDD2649709.1 response regulator [Candidatus Cloacimonadota bacterium]MDX9976813.1 response regulator [Candidatus Cloacimonadales bacterium]